MIIWAFWIAPGLCAWTFEIVRRMDRPGAVFDPWDLLMILPCMVAGPFAFVTVLMDLDGVNRLVDKG